MAPNAPPATRRPIDDDIGLTSRFAAATLPRARQVELKWRWPTMLALLSTVPTFYVELLHVSPPLVAVLSYLLAASTMAVGACHRAPPRAMPTPMSCACSTR